MSNFELMNGLPKCTIIESMDGMAFVLMPGFRKEFSTLEAAKTFVADKKWEVNISFIKGSKIMRDLKPGRNEVI